MKFYLYDQNNSGGSFVRDDTVTIEVLVEAPSAERADAIAETIGIYFDGCDNGRDCDCCGDRWSRAGEHRVVERDKIEQEDPIVYSASSWVDQGQAWRHIYFVDGSKKSLMREPCEKIVKNTKNS